MTLNVQLAPKLYLCTYVIPSRGWRGETAIYYPILTNDKPQIHFVFHRNIQYVYYKSMSKYKIVINDHQGFIDAKKNNSMFECYIAHISGCFIDCCKMYLDFSSVFKEMWFVLRK
jgi:hypothetical protein